MFHGGWPLTSKQKRLGNKKVNSILVRRIADDPSPLSRNFKRQPDVPRCRCGAGAPPQAEIQLSPTPNRLEYETTVASTCDIAPEPHSVHRAVVEEARQRPAHQDQLGPEDVARARCDKMALAEDEAVLHCGNIARNRAVPISGPDRLVLQQAVADELLPDLLVSQILQMDFEERWPEQFQCVEELVDKALKFYADDPDQRFVMKLRNSLPRDHRFHFLFADWAQERKNDGEKQPRRKKRKATKQAKSELVIELRLLLQKLIQACSDLQGHQISLDEDLAALDPDHIRRSITTNYSSNRLDDSESLTGTVSTTDVAELLSQARQDGEDRANRIGSRLLEFCKKDHLNLKVKEANLDFGKLSGLRDCASEIERSSQLREMYKSLKERSSRIDEMTNQIQQLAERKPEDVKSMHHIESIVVKKLDAEFRSEFRNETQQLVVKSSHDHALHNQRLADALSLRAERASQLQRQLTELLKLHRDWFNQQQERLKEEIAEREKQTREHEEEILRLKRILDELRRKIPYAKEMLAQAHPNDPVRLQLLIELGDDKVATDFSSPSDENVISVAFAYVHEQEHKLFPRHACEVATQSANSNANASLAEAVWEPAAFDPTRYQFDRVQKMLQRSKKHNKPVPIRRIFLGAPLQKRLMRLADLFDAPAAGALAGGYTGVDPSADTTPFQQLIFRAVSAVCALAEIGGADSAAHLEAPLLVLVGLLFSLGRLLRCCKLLSLQLGCRAMKIRCNALRGILGKPSPQGAEAAASTAHIYRKAQLLIAHGTQRMRSKLDEFRLIALPATVRLYREVDEIVRVMGDIVRAHEGANDAEEASTVTSDIADLSALLAAVPRDEKGQEIEEGSAALPLHIVQALRYLRTMLRLQHVSRWWLCESVFVPQDSLTEISSELETHRRTSLQILEDRDALRERCKTLWDELQQDLSDDEDSETEAETEKHTDDEVDGFEAKLRKKDLYLKSMTNFKKEGFFAKRVAGTSQRILKQLFERRNSAPGRLEDTIAKELLDDIEIRDCLSLASSVASADEENDALRTKIARTRRRASDLSNYPDPLAAILYDRSEARKDALRRPEERSAIIFASEDSVHVKSQTEAIEPQTPSSKIWEKGITQLRKLLRKRTYGDNKKGGLVKGITGKQDLTSRKNFTRQITIPIADTAKEADKTRTYIDVFIRTTAPQGGSNLQLNIDAGDGGEAQQFVPKTPRRKLLKEPRDDDELAKSLEGTLTVSPAPLNRVEMDEAALLSGLESGRITPRGLQIEIQTPTTVHNVSGTLPSGQASPTSPLFDPGWISAASSRACSRNSSRSKFNFGSISDTSLREDELQEEPESLQINRPSSAPAYTRPTSVLAMKEWDFGEGEQDLTETAQTKGFRRLLQREFGSNDHTSPGFETSMSQCLRRKERPSSAHEDFRWRRKRRHKSPLLDESLQRRYLCLLAPGKTLDSRPLGVADRAPFVGKPLDMFNEFIRDKGVPFDAMEDSLSDDSAGSDQQSRGKYYSSAADDDAVIDPATQRVSTLVSQADEKGDMEQTEEDHSGACPQQASESLELSQVFEPSSSPLPLAHGCQALGIVLHPGWTRISMPADDAPNIGIQEKESALEAVETSNSGPDISRQSASVRSTSNPMRSDISLEKDPFAGPRNSDEAVNSDFKTVSETGQMGIEHSDTPARLGEQLGIQSSEKRHVETASVPSMNESCNTDWREVAVDPMFTGAEKNMGFEDIQTELAGDASSGNHEPAVVDAPPVDNRTHQQNHPSIISVTEVCSMRGDVATNYSQYTAGEDRAMPVSPAQSMSPVEFFLGSEDGFQQRQKAPCGKGNATLPVRPLSAALASSPRSPTSAIRLDGAAQATRSTNRRYRRPSSAVGYLPREAISRPMTPHRRPTSGRRSDPTASRAMAAVAAHRRIQQLRALVASEGTSGANVQQHEEGLVGGTWNLELPIIETRKLSPFHEVLRSSHCGSDDEEE